MAVIIYARSSVVKKFDAPGAHRTPQDASARFFRVWMRNQNEAARRRISGLLRDGVGTPEGATPGLCPRREISRRNVETFF